MNTDLSHHGAIIQTVPEWVLPALIGLFAALVIGAAVSDVRRYVIPNWIPGAIALLWCVWALVAPVDLVSGLIVGIVVFAMGTVLFAFRALGGGDVKLLTAIAFWAGFPDVLVLIFHVAIAGGLLSLVWMLSGRVRVALAYYGVRVSPDAATRVPYGVAISAGGLLMAARLAGI